MKTRIAINGFGRIGRGILRAWLELEDDRFAIVAINDLAPIETLAHLLRFDSVHGRLNADVRIEGDRLLIDGHVITVTALPAPEDLPWSQVDLAFECTGCFTTRDAAARHLENGSARVLVSAPCQDADKTVVYGVNHLDLGPEDLVVSNASCTTNCLAPIAMVIDREIGITTGYMTTVHSYTGDQPSHDSPHKDLYRARAAALSIVPTSTGAARAISEVLPDLRGRLEGSALRVPTPNVSLVELCFMPARATTREEVNRIVQAASEGALKGVVSFEADPLVSIDFNHDPHSSCFAAAQTTVTEDGMVRIVSWYDNEWGFSNRMLDTGLWMGAQLHSTGLRKAG